MSKERTTPIRRQYLQIKRRYPDALVFFRLGDFYETFEEDAKLVSRELEIVLTSREMGRGQRFPMAGIPHHALDSYLGKLIRKGYKVAICEQLSEPQKGKGLVERDVVRVVTPGTVIEPQLLEAKANNYLAALVSEDEKAGLAYVDISTTEFVTAQLALSEALTELQRLRPAELLLPRNSALPDLSQLNAHPTMLDETYFDLEEAEEGLLRQFQTSTLEGFGCAHLPLAIRAAGAILRYLEETQKGVLEQLTHLSTYSTKPYMILDPQTCRNLELFEPSQIGGAGSLLQTMDLTRTPMGGRLMRRWLGKPLLDLQELNRRQEAVEWLVEHGVQRAELTGLLSKLSDLERLTTRVRCGVALPRELLSLHRSLELVPRIKALLSEAPPLAHLQSQLDPCEEAVSLISRAISETEGELIRSGFSPELDELRSLSRTSKQYLAELEARERERTGIKSLKVGYNKVFGYYIEVTTPNLDRVPPDYIRKQTLVGAERFFTPELKEYESLVLTSQERIEELERSLFRQVCQQVGEWGERILRNASALAQLDVFCSFAETAVRYGYTRPELDEGEVIEIKSGRHPVVERYLQDERFVPNDTCLSNRDCQIIILTGPNMSGKSTYLRQVALIVLLAQVGSFVPAEKARIGLVDRIFTRIGLMDDLAAGRSTFMIEMTETANILNNATPRSLIILDEIGRGTSTYDGLSIARAVVEYLHSQPRIGAKTLFATHYHELTELASFLPRVKNFNVAVAEEGGRVIFLRRILPGGTDKSYGIHVAQLAGLPRPVLQRAQQILSELEGERRPTSRKRRESPATQLPLLPPKLPILEELEKLDLDSMTPLEALNKLYELQRKARGQASIPQKSKEF